MSDNACIICMDDGLEPLLENNSCKCKYKKHSSCWEKYTQITNPLKCPTCRKIIKSITLQRQPAPSAPPDNQNIIEYTILPEIVVHQPRVINTSYQQSYQVQTRPLQTTPIQQSNQVIQTVVQQNVLWENLTPEQKKKRIITASIIGIIMTIIIILIIYFVV